MTRKPGGTLSFIAHAIRYFLGATRDGRLGGFVMFGKSVCVLGFLALVGCSSGFDLRFEPDPGLAGDSSQKPFEVYVVPIGPYYPRNAQALHASAEAFFVGSDRVDPLMTTPGMSPEHNSTIWSHPFFRTNDRAPVQHTVKGCVPEEVTGIVLFARDVGTGQIQKLTLDQRDLDQHSSWRFLVSAQGLQKAIR